MAPRRHPPRWTPPFARSPPCSDRSGTGPRRRPGGSASSCGTRRVRNGRRAVRSRPAPCRRRRRPRAARVSDAGQGRAGRGLGGSAGNRPRMELGRPGGTRPRRRSRGAQMAACVQTSYGTVPIAMARSYSANRPRPTARPGSARWPGGPGTGYRRPRDRPRQVGLAVSRSAQRRACVGTERVRQPVVGPRGMTRSSRRMASAGRCRRGSRRPGGPSSRGCGRAGPAPGPGRCRPRPRRDPRPQPGACPTGVEQTVAGPGGDQPVQVPARPP